MRGAKAGVKPHDAKQKKQVKTNGYTYCMITVPRRGPLPERFVVRSDARLNPEYGRSAIGAERPILIPSYHFNRNKNMYASTMQSSLSQTPSGMATEYFSGICCGVRARRLFSRIYKLLRNKGILKRNLCFYVSEHILQMFKNPELVCPFLPCNGPNDFLPLTGV